MSLKPEQSKNEVNAPAEPDAARIDHQPASKGRHLVADLSGIFTNRRHGRGGWYLPVVRGDGRE